MEETFPDPVLVSTPAGAGGARGVAASLEGGAGAGAGRLRAQLAVDYYNRTLSAWEPALEPWRYFTFKVVEECKKKLNPIDQNFNS